MAHSFKQILRLAPLAGRLVNIPPNIGILPAAASSPPQWMRPVQVNHFSSSPPSFAEKTDIAEDLIITDTCVKQLKKITVKGEFLRVTVDGGGCSGFTYKFALESKLEKDDKIFERDGVQVVTDELSLELIKGSKIDYSEELIRNAFLLKDNPQSKGSCSCGVSFSID